MVKALLVVSSVRLPIETPPTSVGLLISLAELSSSIRSFARFCGGESSGTDGFFRLEVESPFFRGMVYTIIDELVLASSAYAYTTLESV